MVETYATFAAVEAATAGRFGPDFRFGFRFQYRQGMTAAGDEAMTTDLRGWQSAHLPTPPAPVKHAPRRWPLVVAALALAGGIGAAGWCFRADLARALHGTRAVAAQASSAAHEEADQHFAARAQAMEHLFDVTVDPHGGDASVIAPPADAVAPATILQPTRAAASPDQVAAAKRGMASADNELGKARAVIARDQAAIRAAHDPQVGAWVRLNALYARARTDRDRYDVSVAMGNLKAQEENATREISENQHLVEVWTQRRATLAATAGVAP
jgi:hypothetical protein